MCFHLTISHPHFIFLPIFSAYKSRTLDIWNDHLFVFIFFISLPFTYTGHGPLPQLTGNVSEVLVSSLLQSCYLSSQTLPRVYQHYGPSPIQPLSTEMQILLTVYYLVQLGQFKCLVKYKAVLIRSSARL